MAFDKIGVNCGRWRGFLLADFPAATADQLAAAGLNKDDYA